MLVEPTLKSPGKSYASVVEGAFVDDIEIDIIVLFYEDKSDKIITRFSPAVLDDVVKRMQATYGKGDNKSRVVQLKNGVENRQTVYFWDFPSAQINLVSVSSNTDFASVSLSAKRESVDSVTGTE